MPITRTRPRLQSITEVSQDKLLRIAEDAVGYLQEFPEYGFSAVEIAARIDTAAPAILIEHALSEADADVEWVIVNSKLYWYHADNPEKE